MKRLAGLALVLACGCTGNDAPLGPDAGADPVDANAIGDLAVGDQALPAVDALVALPDLADGAVGLDPTLYHARADEALERLLIDFWSGPQGYLNRKAPGDGTVTGYWTFAQAWDAALDGVERTQGRRFGGWPETLYLAQDARGWSSDYYDDENWMTLVLLRTYDLTGESRYLDRAKLLFADIQAAWDTTCCGTVKGGIWWDRAHSQKATASNAGPVIAAARLAARTNDPSYLAFARQVYAFWRANMVDAATHEVADHVDPAGAITRWKFTYNEGLMIGAALALSQATQEPAYLADAHQIAGFMVANEVHATAVGNVLSDGANGQCGGDCAQFKGIGYRYLAALYRADKSHTEYWDVLRGSADGMATLARGPAGRIATDWAGPAETPTLIEAQSSAAMALALFAELVGPYPATGAASTYEAEDAILHHIGLEANGAGYAGWGYLAGWNGDGQWVDFHVQAPSAATYKLTLSYAAGAGNASRFLYVNGAVAAANLGFPSTGAWTSYATTSFDVALPAGASTVSVIFNGSMGSTNYLNLDRLVISP